MYPNAIIHKVEQGSEEWHAARNGLITASEVSLILTSTLKIANNDKTRKHVYEIAAQRISGWTEPTFIGWNGERGHFDEAKARAAYNDNIAPIEEIGFITRDIGGCVMGYSPDGAGLIGNFGIECKSRVQKYQVEVITSNEIPQEHILQVQSGLLVTGWDYIDYVSYCGGLPMWVIQSGPIAEYQEAIKAAAIEFEKKVQEVVDQYHERMSECKTLIMTEREDPEMEVYVG